MSLVDLLGYNVLVDKINHVIRGILVGVSMITLMLLLVSSDWVPLNRLLNKSKSAINSGDLLDASYALAHAAQYSPSKFELLEDAGLLAWESGDAVVAKLYLLRVHESQILSSTGLNILGDIAQQEGKTNESVIYWEAANAAQENNETYIKIIRAYQQTGDWDRAIESQRELVALHPNNPDYNYQLGLMLAVTQPESSLAYLSLAGELDPTIKTASNSLVRNLRSALNRDNPSYPFVISGQEMAAIGEWELALLAFTNATQINPDYADAWAYLGETLQQTGHDGYKELEKALKLNPESIAVNTLIALYWQRQERYDLALVYLYAAANLEDDNPALQAEIGNTLGLLGNIPAAEPHYKQATSMEPNNSTYWNSLANYYIRYEIEIKDKGAAAARQAVILSPQDPVSLDILAQIYLLQDNTILAERFLERALTADDEYAPAHLHSGLVNILEGDQLGAYQHFSAALSLSQSGSSTNDQAQRLLETYFP